MNFIKRAVLKSYRWAKAQDEDDRYAAYRKKYNIHETARFNGPGTRIEGEGKLSIGAHSYVGMNSLLLPEAGYEIRIGEHCAISHYFCIYTKNIVSDEDLSKRRSDQRISGGSVIIGDYCWIGFRVFVREGVRIGNHVTVGAHSVVVDDLDDGGVYAGVPARLIRKK